MEVSPYLNFDGRCAEAFHFYAEALGGTLTMMTYGESPMVAEMPADWQDKIINVQLKAGALTVMGCDVPPNHYRPMQGFGVALTADTVAEVERAFNALSAGGNVTMALQKTFWSERFGMCTDRYGTTWLVGVAQAA
jgi:PhnB protein